jgi:dTDP-glucose pyrophosphorylase
LIRAGATNLCFVISPGKSDILEYFGGMIGAAHICYTVQPRAGGLCDAVFCALPLIHPDDSVMIGLPDTIWFPEDGLRGLADDAFSMLLFPVARPEQFDVVLTDDDQYVREIQVKPYFGSLVNAYLALGGTALGVYTGQAYVDVGTVNGYREAIQLLASRGAAPTDTVPLSKSGRRKTDIDRTNPTR